MNELAAPRRTGRSTLGVALLWGAVALVVYTLFAREAFYKIDGPFLVYRLVQGEIQHPYVVLYMPLLALTHAALAPLGSSPYTSAVTFSALGTAAGIALTAVAFRRLGMAGWRWHAATALVMLAAPVFLFATVVELHGPFFAWAALATVLMVELARRPTWLLALAVGVATHLAYAAHPTGMLLPALLLPWFLALRWSTGTRGRDVGLAVVAGGIHVVLAVAMPQLLPEVYQFLGRPRVAGAGLERGIGLPRHIGYLPVVLWQEWLLAYAPISVAFVVAFRSAATRAEAFALLVGLTPYVGLCLWLIVGEPEHGAYLLPLAIPAARLTALSLPRPWVVATVVLSGAWALAVVERQVDPAPYRAWAEGARASIGDRPALLFLGDDLKELKACMSQLSEHRIQELPRLVDHTIADRPDLIRAVFDQYLASTAPPGTAVFVTEGCWQALETGEHPARASLLEHMRESYGAREVTAGSFHAWQLQRGE